MVMFCGRGFIPHSLLICVSLSCVIAASHGMAFYQLYHLSTHSLANSGCIYELKLQTSCPRFIAFIILISQGLNNSCTMGFHFTIYAESLRFIFSQLSFILLNNVCIRSMCIDNINITIV